MIKCILFHDNRVTFQNYDDHAKKKTKVEIKFFLKDGNFKKR